MTELRALSSEPWRPETPFSAAGDAQPINQAWRALPLRSVGGAMDRTDPGGPGLDGFRATRATKLAPYMVAALDELPCELRSARLLLLPPGEEIAEHTDPHHGFISGQVRLHIPIVTNPHATLTIGSETHTWGEGQLWYGDFSKPHSLANRGRRSRVHLVIDCLVNDGLLRLFPRWFTERLSAPEVLTNRPAISLPVAHLCQLRSSFSLPASVLRTAGATYKPVAGTVAAEVSLVGDRLVLKLDGAARFGLVPVSPFEFRFTGWCDERTIAFSVRDGVVRHISLRLRRGNHVRELICPAQVDQVA